MRVKLSYTVAESDILPEAAKILGLSADDMKQAIDLFQQIQAELSKKGENSPNTEISLEMLEELRLALLNVDTRVMEVVEIIEGYENYRVSNRGGKGEEAESVTTVE